LRIKRDSLDILFSRYIRARDKYCQRCGSSSGLQACHFIGRARRSVRWDDDNAICLCFGCHAYFTAHPLEFVEWFTDKLGQDKVDLLRARERIREKPDKEGLKLYYTVKLKELVQPEIDWLREG